MDREVGGLVYKRILLTVLILLMLCGKGLCAYENFSTGWSEGPPGDPDPNNKLSQTTTRATFTDLTQDEEAYVEKDSAISFTGDFDVAFDFFFSDVSDDVDISLVQFWTGDDTKFVEVTARLSIGEPGYLQLNLQAIDLDPFDIEGAEEDSGTLLDETILYARFRRNDDGGTNGMLYLDVYGSSANRDNDVSVLVHMEQDITVIGQEDFTVARATFTYDDGWDDESSGFIENLDLNYVPPVSARRIIRVNIQ